MFDEIYPDERAASLAQSIQRPLDPPKAPGAFQGFGDALMDALPYAANTSASAWAAIFDAYGKAAAYRDAPSVAMIHGQPAPDIDQLKRETIDQMGNSEVARGFRERAKDFTPDPAAVGLAGQITHGVLATLAKAGTYAATTGPAAPVLFGADLGINRAQELSDKGVDGGTAAAAGVVSGVAGAVGMRLPAAMGATRVQSATIGAGVNPALTVAEVGGIHAILAQADYGQIAAQYDPFDPVNLAVSAITGAAFGGAFHQAKASGTRITPEEHAAAMTMHEVHVRAADALVKPDDFTAANTAHDAQVMARRQLDAGEPVGVANRVDIDPTRADAIMASVRGSLAEHLPADALQAAPSVQPDASLASPTPEQASLPETPAPVGIVESVREAVSRLFAPEVKPDTQAATPEIARAQAIAARSPDMTIPSGLVDEAGTPVAMRASDLLARADEIEATAKTESAAFRAAVNCALRFTQ